MDWINVNKKLPPVDNENEFNQKSGFSERLLVREKGSDYFGFYSCKSEHWVVEGRLGNINVTHWMKIEDPKD